MFEFIFSLVIKMTFVSKAMVQKSAKFAHLQYIVTEALRWRATRPGVLFKVLWYANKCIASDFRIHLFFGQKNDFCIKRDGSKIKSHVCNVKYRKLCDGEQHVLVFFKVLWNDQQVYRVRFSNSSFLWSKNDFCIKRDGSKIKSHVCNIKYRKLSGGEQHVMMCLKLLWYHNKCITTDFRIHLFFGQKNDFCIKRDGSKIKSHVCNVKYRKLCDGEQHVMVFFKVLWYANKCITTDVRIHLFFGQKNDFCIKRHGSKIGKIAHLQYKISEALRWRATRPWCFWKYSGMPTCVSRQIFEFIFSLVKKMTFVSIRMDQKSGNSHICSIKYRKLCDGEQQVMVFLKVLWYANKCITTDFRIHLFFGQKNDFCIKRDGSKIGKIALLQYKISEALWWRATRNGVFEITLVCTTSVSRQMFEFIFSLVKKMTFVSKGMAQKSGKSHICSIKYRKLCDGEQHVPVFFKVLCNANKCIAPDVRIHLFFGQTNDFCIKRDGSKIWKIARLQYKITEALRWRASRPGVYESTLVCQQVYGDRFSNSSFLWSKNDFCIKRDGTKIGKIALLQYKISEALRWRATRPGGFQSTLVCQQVYRARCSNSSFLWQKKWLLYQ